MRLPEALPLPRSRSNPCCCRHWSIRGVLSPSEGVEVSEKALEAAAEDLEGNEEAVANVTVQFLEQIREGMMGMGSLN